jgi:hypothetical protein
MRLSVLFLLLLPCTWSRGAVPSFTVVRTRALYFAASDLTSNGVPGLTNAPQQLLVWGLPNSSAHGGRVAMVNTQAWFRRYNGAGNGYDVPIGLAPDQQAGATLTGPALGSSSYDWITIRYTSDGTPLWTNRFDGDNFIDDFPSNIALDHAGNTYVLGYSVTGMEMADAILVKYASSGTALWTNRFNPFGTNYYAPAGLATDAAGNVIMALNPLYADDGLPTVVKYDPIGTPLWTNHYRGSEFSSDYINAIGVDAGGNLFVTGTDYFMLKYSPDGVALWTNRMSDYGVPSALVIDRTGSAIVSGDLWLASGTNGADPANRFYATIKYASDGTRLWTNLMATPNYQGGSMPRLVLDLAGSPVVIGGTEGTRSNADFTILKLRADGVPVWTNRFFDTYPGRPGLVAGAGADAAGQIYFTTSTTGPDGANVDFLTVKYSANGTLLWSNRFDGPVLDSDSSTALGLNEAGEVYVAGTTKSLNGAGDFGMVKYVEYIHYTPPSDFVGTDTFTFVASAPSGTSVTNTVTVIVAEPLWCNLSSSNLRGDASGLRLLHFDRARSNAPAVLQVSTDFQTWSPIATNMPAAGAVEFLIPINGESHEFYRALQ